MEDRLLYRVPEVALILNISRSKVYELFASGELESVLSAVANAQRDLQVSTGRALLEGTALGGRQRRQRWAPLLELPLVMVP